MTKKKPTKRTVGRPPLGIDKVRVNYYIPRGLHEKTAEYVHKNPGTTISGLVEKLLAEFLGSS